MTRVDLPEPSTEAREHSAQLSALLRKMIAAHGSIPFSTFMERCLYAPGLGYYSAGTTKFGAAGDFITAPELGSLFARCVAQVVAPTLQACGNTAQMLELGGGSGAFAEQALLELARRQALPAQYCILEPSAELRNRQQQRLSKNLPPDLTTRVQWLERPPETAWHGVLFANEVVDALPATRFSIAHGEVFEQHVAVDAQGRFVYQDRPADLLVQGAVRHLERRLGQRFADGYRSELLPQLPYWLQAVAGTLQTGLMLLIDYGYPRQEYYLPERDEGTLRAFYRHRIHNDVLAWPGLQDLTASVDFSALAEAGPGAGFELAAYLSQAQFLLASGLAEFHAAVTAQGDPETLYRLSQEIKHLTLPAQMGECFQAMLFTRELEPLPLNAGLLAADARHRL